MGRSEIMLDEEFFCFWNPPIEFRSKVVRPLGLRTLMLDSPTQKINDMRFMGFSQRLTDAKTSTATPALSQKASQTPLACGDSMQAPLLGMVCFHKFKESKNCRVLPCVNRTWRAYLGHVCGF